MNENRAVFSISSIFALRMLAIFMFLPVFTLYASSLQGANPFLIGIAIGIYGLAQAICQLSFGSWSDQHGRKPMIVIGLCFFIIGSLLGAVTHSIYLMIIARTLQGMGAVGSTLMALLADLTSEKNRTKNMAILGVGMGVSSTLAMIAGPAIAAHYHLSGLFLVGAMLTTFCLIILWRIVPQPSKINFTQTSLWSSYHLVLKDALLRRWSLGIFLLHAIFTALFYACPLLLKPLLHDSAYFYLSILGISFVLLFPSIFLVEKKKKMPQAYRASIFLLLMAQIILYFFHQTLIDIGIALVLFFLGFNFLEAALPSMMSKQASASLRGTTMSLYSCAQFLGIFVGGILAGTLYSLWNIEGIFGFTTILAAIWLIV